MERTNSLTVLNKGLLNDDNKIIELKYSGKKFGVMVEDERWFAAKTVLLKIHAITGWSVPVSELMDILVDQFQQKLLESYKNVTIKEVEYAFRNKSSDIKDWGKAMNLSLFDEVMIPYLEIRFDLSRIEESNSNKPTLTLDEAAKVMTDEEWQEWLKDIRTYDFKIFPSTAYDYLVKKEKICITKEQKHEYMNRAIAHLSGTLDPIDRKGIEFAAMKKEGFYNAEITGTLKTFAKRFALQDYFNTHPNE